MKIDAYLTPLFPEKETLFDDSIVIMIDVLRASTTICAALYNGAKEVIPSDSLDKAVHIYSSLSRETRFLGGERQGIKPNGFDAGNSPLDYPSAAVHGKTIIITTTNGTKIYQKAKRAKARIVGGFVNINEVIEHINQNYLLNNQNLNVIILCAGNDGRVSYEDTLCAGAFIEAFESITVVDKLGDSATIAKDLYNLHKANYKDYLKTRDHASYLQTINFGGDIDMALTMDKYPVVPVIFGSSIRRHDNGAIPVSNDKTEA